MVILKKWIREFLSVFVFLRFPTIWKLYDYLLTHKKDKGIAASVFTHYVDNRGGYIGIGAKFGNIPYFPHGFHGVFISKYSVIGKNAVIFQGVTIGAVRTKGSKRTGNPTIGDNCYIGAGAKIIGDVHIGNNCRIGANAVVYEDMPDNSVAVCSPTRSIEKKEPLDNRFFMLDGDENLCYWENGSFHKEEE